MNGKWNGEPAKFYGITYVVTGVEHPPLHWQNAETGTIRQGLLIVFKGDEFIIDNEHGDGFTKVAIGDGMWTAGHKSVVDPLNVQPIPDDQINTDLDVDGLLKERARFDVWAKETNPFLFARLEDLRKQISQNDKTLAELDRASIPKPRSAGKMVVIKGTNQKVFIQNKKRN